VVRWRGGHELEPVVQDDKSKQEEGQGKKEAGSNGGFDVTETRQIIHYYTR